MGTGERFLVLAACDADRVKAHLHGVLNPEVIELAQAEHGDDVAGRSPLFRSALNVVTPAHIRGAASTGGSSAGISATALAGAIKCSA